MRPAATAAQTIGPYWHLLDDPALADLTRFGAVGQKVEIVGAVTDGLGFPVTDACVEIWQSTPAASATFPGFGRAATDAAGQYAFRTIRPAASGLSAPHIAVAIFARGLLKALTTRLYFDRDTANAGDPVLNLVPAARRATLLARPDNLDRWRFDIRLQGDAETVFLDV